MALKWLFERYDHNYYFLLDMETEPLDNEIIEEIVGENDEESTVTVLSDVQQTPSPKRVRMMV